MALLTNTDIYGDLTVNGHSTIGGDLYVGGKSLTEYITSTSGERSRVFYVQPVGPYKSGDLWINGSTIYICYGDATTVINRLSGEFFQSDWVEITSANFDLELVSSRTSFKRGENNPITISVKVFQNGRDVTSVIPPERFHWTKINNDGTEDTIWGNLYGVHVKSVVVYTQDILRCFIKYLSV